eukprot:CAMPEP_0194086784 /NCGR_PEP_ID=MMETSP0149-20130528/22419_1 /TAXON_ID=122233 /ORGANISM="Chaetoceros debilis, Strain MM31A-1" /LENGTH=703 /DNA_ID=CAMNT_0038769963 /DNA_START=69 /DNA_END=2177 /DNA_ORIENTATION=-
MAEEQDRQKIFCCAGKLLSYIGISKGPAKILNESDVNRVVNGDEEEDILENNESHIQLQTAFDERQKKEWSKARNLHDRLFSTGGTFVLGYGEIDDFHQGLDVFLGSPKKLLLEAMEKEHCEGPDSDTNFNVTNHGITTTSAIEWHYVIDPEKGLEKLGLKGWPSETIETPDEHRRKLRTLEDLEESLVTINTRLAAIGIHSMTMTEVIACRLYTGPLGVKYNKMIRANIAGRRTGQEWRMKEERTLCKGNKYPTTMHVIQSAIAKLGKINPNREAYCGISDGLLPPWFWDNHTDLGTKGGVECSFMSLSTDKGVATYYAGKGENKAIGTIFEVDMSTMDRGAEVNWLSQYPHENETILPPLTYLHIQHICRGPPISSKPILIVKLRSRLSHAIMVEPPLLTAEENANIKLVVKGNAHSTFESNAKLLSKFSDEKNYLITGNPMEAVLGLSYFLGVSEDHIQSVKAAKGGIAAMALEIEAGGEEELIRNMKYIFYEKASELQLSNGIRDLNNSGKTLQAFANHRMAKKYNLRESHVAALRLYTTSAFRFLNAPLRNSMQKNMTENMPHPYPVTVSLIDEGIKRLRALTAEAFGAKTDIFLWRGMRNTTVDEHFLEGRRGGTELGLMSTTKNVKIAAEYSNCSQGNALLFKFKIGNMKQFGADISWLSAFPSEAEILYPPLTFLQPTGRVETTTINGMLLTVVE